jgi:hypothetical protein
VHRHIVPWAHDLFEWRCFAIDTVTLPTSVVGFLIRDLCSVTIDRRRGCVVWLRCVFSFAVMPTVLVLGGFRVDQKHETHEAQRLADAFTSLSNSESLIHALAEHESLVREFPGTRKSFPLGVGTSFTAAVVRQMLFGKHPTHMMTCRVNCGGPSGYTVFFWCCIAWWHHIVWHTHRTCSSSVVRRLFVLLF